MKVQIKRSELLKCCIGQTGVVHLEDEMGAYVWMSSGRMVYFYKDEYEEA